MAEGPDPSDPRWRPPELLERYDVATILGRGSSGIAFRAVQRSLKRPVVLKVVAWDASVGEVERKRFEGEARLLARLSHPHVLSVLDFGFAPGLAYLAYPDQEGTTLDRWARARWPPPGLPAPREALSLFDQVLGALDHIHGAGVVHRDLKPANVLVTRGGAAKVFDFGLARDLARPEALTRTGVILGTPLYMAPDQIRGQDPDPRDDLYSAGLIVYELLTGSHPFKDKDLAMTMAKQANQIPPSLVEAGLDVPGSLAELVADLLAKARRERPGSAAAARDRLAAVLPELAAGTTTRSRPLPAPASPVGPVLAGPGGPPAGRGRPVGAGLALAALVAALAWPATRETAPTDPPPPPEAPSPHPAAPAAGPPDPSAIGAARTELSELRRTTLERLRDPRAWTDGPDRLPRLFSILGWIGRGGIPARDLDPAAIAALGELDLALAGLGLPRVLAPFLPPSPERPVEVLLAEAKAEARARMARLAGRIGSRPAGEAIYPESPELSAWIEGKTGMVVPFQDAARTFRSLAEAAWTADAGIRIAWARLIEPVSIPAMRWLWLCGRVERGDAGDAFAAGLDFARTSGDVGGAFYSAYGFLPFEVLHGGPASTATGHAVQASFLDRSSWAWSHDPAAFRARVRACRDSWLRVLALTPAAHPDATSLCYVAYWWAWSAALRVGDPIRGAAVFREHLLPRRARQPDLAPSIAAQVVQIRLQSSREQEDLRELGTLLLAEDRREPGLLGDPKVRARLEAELATLPPGR